MRGKTIPSRHRRVHPIKNYFSILEQTPPINLVKVDKFQHGHSLILEIN